MLNHMKYLNRRETEVEGVLEVKSPNKIPDVDCTRVFLAGSIEQGKARKWHQEIVDATEKYHLKDYPIILLNPRRDDWNSSWVQDIEKNPEFRTQVDWEMTGLNTSDIVVINFEDDTQSPISLLELGFVAGLKLERPRLKVIVRCSPNFWRYGNVQYVCSEFGFFHVHTMEEFIHTYVKVLKEHNRD